jgi:hypothetical protein
LPKLAKVLRDYPSVKVEIIVDYGLTEILAERFEGGVCSGEKAASAQCNMQATRQMSPSLIAMKCN